jgi:hypothetical protein
MGEDKLRTGPTIPDRLRNQASHSAVLVPPPFCNPSETVNVLSPAALPYFRKSTASPVCPSGKSNMYLKMSIEQLWNDTDKGKPKY